MKRRVPAVVLSVVLTLALLVGCGSADVASDPAWGRQPCAHCAMLLDDAHSAAQLVRDDGARFFFDDIGCMIAYEHELGIVPRHAWVHDASGPAWIDAQKAVYSRGQPTPMDFGYVAHAGGAGATFDGVRAQVVARLTEADGDHGIP